MWPLFPILSPQFSIPKLLVLYTFIAEDLNFCWPLKMVKVLCQRGGKKKGSIFSYSS